ncbi:CpaF family protein [Catenulispora pinisilvae]|uniref:CpaF family protein n=2 Tax=Catenulispora TaxID=414878 RepID=UPI001890D693|nr:ATPase, T2SS/T4P/T4SS family [Catenulispora pinisilvae]
MSVAVFEREALSEDEQHLVRKLRASVGARLADRVGENTDSAERQRIGRVLIDDALIAHARAALADGGLDVLNGQAETRVARAVFDALFGMGGLQRWLDDPEVENITANGHDCVFIHYADGRKVQVGPIAASEEDFVDLLRTIAARAGTEERMFDRAHPQLNIQLPDGSRLFAVMAVSDRVSMTVRRHRHMAVSLQELSAMGVFDLDIAAQLAAAVRAKLNILVCGGMGHGKTTLVRALAACISPEERLVTIEDTYELALGKQHPDVVAMQARQGNLEGNGEVTQADLVRMSLRMNASRVIVGEVRGEELVSMLNAMMMGSDGSIGTMHASTSKQAFDKLASYAIQAPERLDRAATNLLVSTALHVVIQLRRLRDGSRVISSIREITGVGDNGEVTSNEVLRPDRQGRAVPGTGWTADTADLLIEAGLDPVVLERSARAGWSL